VLRTIGISLLLISAFAAEASAADCGGMADTVLLRGKVLTVDSSDRVVQAIGIRQNRIVSVGTDREVEAYRCPEARVIDLGGRTVIPGLTDAHIHAIRDGQSYRFEAHWNGIPTL